MTEEIKLKNEINSYFTAVYQQSLANGKNGHYESMFQALHKTIEVFCVQPVEDGVPLAEKVKRYERDKLFWHFVRCVTYLIVAIKIIEWVKDFLKFPF